MSDGQRMYSQQEMDAVTKERDEVKHHMDLARQEAGCPDDETLVIHCREMREKLDTVIKERDEAVKECLSARATAKAIVAVLQREFSGFDPAMSLEQNFSRALADARRLAVAGELLKCGTCFHFGSPQCKMESVKAVNEDETACRLHTSKKQLLDSTSKGSAYDLYE